MNWFFDLGSHLFESADIFSQLVKDPQNWNVGCVEPAYTDDNKVAIDRLLTSQDYASRFKSFTFIPVAVSTYTGIAKFKRDFSYPNSGSSSLICNKPMYASKTVSIPCVDVASLMMSTRDGDNILLKVDIEGAEYAIFARLEETNLLARVSAAYIELHEYKLSRNIALDYRLLSQVRNCRVPMYEWESQAIRAGATLKTLPVVDENYIKCLYSLSSFPTEAPPKTDYVCVF